MASTQIHQSKHFLCFHFGLKPMNQHHPVFQFLINIEYCDFLLEMQNVLLETLIHVRICYVSKLVAFCKTYQCFLLDFPLLFDTRKKKPNI